MATKKEKVAEQMRKASCMRKKALDSFQHKYIWPSLDVGESAPEAGGHPCYITINMYKAIHSGMSCVKPLSQYSKTGETTFLARLRQSQEAVGAFSPRSRVF